jgi:hypothetical protein
VIRYCRTRFALVKSPLFRKYYFGKIHNAKLARFLRRRSTEKNRRGYCIIYDKLRIRLTALMRHCRQRHYARWLCPFSILRVDPLRHEPKLPRVLDYIAHANIMNITGNDNLRLVDGHFFTLSPSSTKRRGCAPVTQAQPKVEDNDPRAKDSGLTVWDGRGRCLNHAAATPNRAVRMAGRCGVGQTARLYGR